ncbi:uncharacterized protein [Rutidosis leptorrhynchoides]|uniref:uncharacterized protein n=1 Tax=Rutidosis leptorrhynchoides TaxID=125765 RepID=UPI003A99606F
MFDLITKEAHKLQVLWSGSELYQAKGVSGEQYVVDLQRKICTCRRWEITGMPCKHGVASIWNMADNSGDVGIPEKWVNPIYFLDTWKRTYAFTINPINGRSMWKEPTANKLLPPIIVPQAGRPKKNRRKGIDENESMNNNGKLSRRGKSATCGNCGVYGHNKRGCPNGSQNVDQSNNGSKNVGQKRKKQADSSGTKKK